MNGAAVASAYTKPEQAPDRSKPHAFFAPILVWTRQALDGKNIAGVTVATMIKSNSAGSSPRFLHHRLAAAAPMSLVAWPFSAIRRSRTTVLSQLLSSELTAIFSTSLLVIRRSDKSWL